MSINPSPNYTAIYLSMAGVFIALGGGVMVYKNMTTNEAPTPEKEATNSDITNFFYNIPSYRDEVYLLPGGSKPQDDDFADLQNEKETIEYQLPIVTTPVAPRSEPTQQRQAPTERPRYTKEELLIPRQPLKTADELMEERRQAMLHARRVNGGSWNRTIDISAIEANEREKSPPKAKDYSEHQINKDVSTFPVDLTRTITADRYIDCALKEQVNSQLEGRVTCQVINDVYGVHGRKNLIPAGSTFIGKHTSLKKVGDERFNIIWERIIRAGDGVHIKLTDAYSSDRIGSTGIGGIVDNRNWEKYGGAILTSVVSTLAQISVPVRSGSITNSVVQNFGTDLGQVTAAMINEGINIKPYSIVPAGTIIKVTPTTDIWLKHFDKDGGILAPVEEK
uniref:Inner membrane protein of type IV secretion of T-DNA complex, TonB-like, VirB10 n=1 Tax=Vibrio sp. FF_291 TaxID=1652832 RepID=A0A0H3ZN52_9VIBR|nr:Inner membrane protein of type IV secretion of T-DNA complex, TonB-like, VirB10 [Vibrio sp. FF_291]